MSLSNADAPSRNKCGCSHSSPIPLSHEDQPLQRLLGGPDTASGFEADLVACHFVELADGAHHHEMSQRWWRWWVPLAAGGVLMKPSRLACTGWRGDVFQSTQFAGGDDGSCARRAAGFAEGLHFVVKRARQSPFNTYSREITMSISAAPSFTLALISLDLLREGRQAGRESGRDRCNRNARAFQRLDRGLHERVIDADSARGEQLVESQIPEQFRAMAGALAQRR